MSKIQFKSEKDMEDHLYNEFQEHCEISVNSGEDSLPEDSLISQISTGILDSVKRQVKIGNYGIADIVIKSKILAGMDVEINCFTIVELKNVTLESTHLIQLIRYMKGFSRLSPNAEIYGVLIGTNMGNGDWVYLLDYVKNINVYTIKIPEENLGIENHREYILTNEGFEDGEI